VVVAHLLSRARAWHVFAELAAFRDTVGFIPGHQTQYEKDLAVVADLTVSMQKDVQRRMFSPKALNMPFDTSQQLLEATASAFSAVFVKLRDVGSPAESLWKLLHNIAPSGLGESDREALRKVATDIKKGFENAAQNEVPVGVCVGAGLLLSVLQSKKAADAQGLWNERAREDAMRRRMRCHQLQNARIRAIHRMVQVLQKTQGLAAKAAEDIRWEIDRRSVPLAATDAGSPTIEELTFEAAAMECTVRTMRGHASKAKLLVEWMVDAKNRHLLSKLEDLIRERLRKGKRARRSDAAADAAAPAAAAPAAGGSADPQVLEEGLEALGPLMAEGAASMQQQQQQQQQLQQQRERMAVQINPDAAVAAQAALEDVETLVGDSMPPGVGNIEQLRAARNFATATAEEARLIIEETTQYQNEIDRAIESKAYWEELARIARVDLLDDALLKGTFEEEDEWEAILAEPMQQSAGVARTSSSNSGAEAGTAKSLLAQAVLDACNKATEGATADSRKADEGEWHEIVDFVKRMWQHARQIELAIAARVEWIAERRRRLVDLYVHLLRQKPDLDTLNDALNNAAAPTAAARLSSSSNSRDIPDEIDGLQVWGWEGAYRAYLGGLLRADLTVSWSLAEVPLTPRQWLMSHLNAGAYPDAPSAPSAPSAAAAADAPAAAAAAAPAFVDNTMKGVLERIVKVHRKAVESLPLHAPFAFDFDGTIDVNTLDLDKPAWAALPRAARAGV